MYRIFSLTLFSLIILSSRDIFPQTKEEKISKGIDYIYHVKFDSAQMLFNEIVTSDPGDPAGYFFLAMVDWWRINLNKENDSLDNIFFKKAEKVVEITDERLDKNERDDEAMFYKGGALGYSGLVNSLRENWLKAAEQGKEALNLLQEAYEINPGNKDVIFGIGMYNYFAEYVPDKYPVVKPLMLIFPKGDKNKGLMQIKESSQDSKYTKAEAKYVLAYLNLVYEKNYPEAETYSKMLNEEFPENPIFEKYLYNSYNGLGKWDMALTGWKKILTKIDSNTTGYTTLNLKREANYYAALCLLRLNRFSEAGEYIKVAEEITKILDKENEYAYSAFIYLIAGMYNDFQGNRASAENYYDKVLKMPNFQNSHSEAEKFLKEAYK
ncbi:MAG TPA: hypothetical protein PKC58_06035 [Ignavibacteria bacterium]|nr:hypothetical protein [Ignavibacteria bacterium]